MLGRDLSFYNQVGKQIGENHILTLFEKKEVRGAGGERGETVPPDQNKAWEVHPRCFLSPMGRCPLRFYGFVRLWYLGSISVKPPFWGSMYKKDRAAGA